MNSVEFILEVSMKLRMQQKEAQTEEIMNSGKQNVPNEQGNKNLKEVIYEQNNCNRKPKRWCW